MSFGYSKQFKRDEGVAKLKTLHDLKDTQMKTRQLENDKKKMEERLQELRMAMEIEKEERTKRSPGGAFWNAGTEGPMVNHAQNVLNQPAPDLSKVKKIVVLKDEPVTPPSGTSKSAAVSRPPPGTMAHIASRSAIPHPKVVAAASQQNNTSSCGQCETQLATMHCRECGENFCRGCFASFHVRGALRGHHPVVVSSAPPPPKPDVPSPPRIAFESPSSGSARQVIEKSTAKKVKFTSDSPQASDRSAGTSQAEKTVATFQIQTDDDMVSQTSGSLNYDEQSVNTSFADEWTAAVNAVASQLVNQATRTQAASSASSGPLRAPSNNTSKTPTMSTCGTSTDVGSVNQPLADPVTEIQFTSTGISYKDRLLINKHRRFELPPPNLMLVPKPPPVPSAGTRRLRQSKEGAVSTSTKLSTDLRTTESPLPDRLDFDTIEEELKKIDNDGVLLVNGRPGSAVSLGSARWKHALEIELADDEMMLQTFSKPVKDNETTAKSMKFDDYIDEIVEISDFGEVIESARTPVAIKPPEPEIAKIPAVAKANSENEQAEIDLNQQPPSPSDTITIKSRPNSSRPVSARKKPEPDQMKRVPTKSRAQLSSEFGAHQLSTQPSKELKQVVSSLTTAARPASKAAVATLAVDPSPSHVGDFLMMGVENKEISKQQKGGSTPRPTSATPRPGSAAKTPRQSVNTSGTANYSVYKIGPATWKPLNSLSVDEAASSNVVPLKEEKEKAAVIDGDNKPNSPGNNAKRAPSPAIQVIMKLRFPEGKRSSEGQRSSTLGEEKNGGETGRSSSRPGTEQERRQVGLTTSLGDDDDVTPRNSVGSPAFLGRVANKAAELRAESASSKQQQARVPFSTAVVGAARSPSASTVAIPSPRPSSAGQRAAKGGYAQPRTPLQQSIEAWRATSRQEQEQPDIGQLNVSGQLLSSSDDEENESESAGFCGRLAVNNNNALSSTRSVGAGSKSQINRHPEDQKGVLSSSITPRPRSSTAAPRLAVSQTTVDSNEDEEEEEDNETLRSLTEELKVEVSRSRDVSMLPQEESDVQIPIVSSSKLPAELDVDASYEDGDNENNDAGQSLQVPAPINEEQNSFLNDEDNFDDKMALAELASELQINSNHPTTYPRMAGLSANRGSGSGSLANLLHGSSTRESQATLTSITSCWVSSPSNSGSFTTASGTVGNNNNNNLPAVAEDDPAQRSSRDEQSARSPLPPSGRRVAGGKGAGMVFNAHSHSKGEFAIRQSSLMDDFDDVEKRLREDDDENY